RRLVGEGQPQILACLGGRRLVAPAAGGGGWRRYRGSGGGPPLLVGGMSARGEWRRARGRRRGLVVPAQVAPGDDQEEQREKSQEGLWPVQDVAPGTLGLSLEKRVERVRLMCSSGPRVVSDRVASSRVRKESDSSSRLTNLRSAR